jgi:hypothetical protein
MSTDEPVVSVEYLADELKNTVARVATRHAAQRPQDPEDFVVLRGNVEAIIEQAEKRVHFGTSEEPAMVRADQLVPGVRMDGHTFNCSFSVIVEKVKPLENGGVWVTAYSSSAQRYPERTWRNDTMVETWGKL